MYIRRNRMLLLLERPGLAYRGRKRWRSPANDERRAPLVGIRIRQTWILQIAEVVYHGAVPRYYQASTRSSTLLPITQASRRAGQGRPGIHGWQGSRRVRADLPVRSGRSGSPAADR